MVLLTCLLVDPGSLLARHTGPGAFYAVIPHEVMVAGFGAVSLFVLLALVMGVAQLLARPRPERPGPARSRRPAPRARATR